ncbi:MAG: M20/M25/M40 family metallo-hydrolase, partial [Actinomycetota bacterium]|nr:M20/M25/M40 family metallo-hydrolase [Actinomycetota bacterium]
MRTHADPPREWLDELFEWLRIPSVSADPAHLDDVRRAGQWVCDFVRRAGGEAELVETATQPLAVGELRASTGADGAPTVLIYGHFDVQPPAPLDLWASPPFEPEIRDGYLYARGIADDKGQAYLLLKAAALLAAEGALPVNARVAMDGEEEVGGHSIVDFLSGDDRGADACVIFDSAMPREDVPSFDLGTRGLVYFHLRVRTGAADLHSGVFGGAALNGIHALMRALEPALAVPDELRAGVVEPTQEELASWALLDPGADVLAGAGARPMDERAAEEFYRRTLAGPAVDVNGVTGGEALLQKTVLPVSAEANVSIRLAPGQDTEEIASAFERLVRDAAPDG